MLEITSVIENPAIQCEINILIVYVRISPRNRIKKKMYFHRKAISKLIEKRANQEFHFSSTYGCL